MQELIVKNILRQFRIGKRYNGYDYIVHAIGLAFFDERFMSCVTKVLYITIAQNYGTSSLCVEKSIRKVIETIWENDENKILIEKLFGSTYVHNKPSNKEFLWLLYEYIDSFNLIGEIFNFTENLCPISQDTCDVYINIVNTLRNMS